MTQPSIDINAPTEEVRSEDLDEDEEEWLNEPDSFDNFISFDEQLKNLPKIPSILPSQFTEFAFRMPLEDGTGYTNFSFNGRKHMRRCYDTPAKRVLLVAGRQVEKSTLLGNIALCYSCMINAYKTLYVSASSTQSKTFSTDRIKEPIETSPVLKSYTTNMLSQNVFEKQFVNRSKITLRYAFLNADRCRGLPAHLLLLDEIQDILSENIPVIEQCTSHAPEKLKRFIYSGTPKSLDNTIEYYRANLSTQGEWVVPCDAHGGETGRHWNILGENNIGKHSLVCEKCDKAISPTHPDAQWAKMVHEAPFEGYRIPQIMVPWKPWSEILLDYERYPRDKFYNEVLGISYDSGTRPLNPIQLQECCDTQATMAPIYIDKYRRLAFAQPIFAGIDWGCHDDKTRILTECGFKFFKDLTVQDKVAQFNQVTREMTFVKPSRITVRDWDGDLLHFFGRKGSDLLITPTHRMLAKRSGSAKWHIKSAEEVANGKEAVTLVGQVNWAGEERKTFCLPGLPVSPGYSGCQPRIFDMDTWLEFLGYYLAEGGLCFNRDSRRGRNVHRPSCLKMSQRASVNWDKLLKIRRCMQRGKIQFSEFPNPKTGDVNWTIHGKQFWQWILDNVGKSCSTKRIPREFLQLSKRQLQILFDAMLLGDGTYDKRKNNKNGCYNSTSLGLCEDFQELCIRLGLRATVALHKKAEGNRKARYRTSWSKGRDWSLLVKKNVKRVPYKGKVYCCTVPDGLIVTERNGRIGFQGNTGNLGYSVITLGIYDGLKFRIFYVHRFVGEDVDPIVQIERISEIIQDFNVSLVGCDWGFGFGLNDQLVRKFGRQRIWKYHYMARTKKKVEWDAKLGRFKVHRTEIMSDVFNAIKRKQLIFPRWEEFKTPYAQDMLNIFSEYNENLRMIQYSHSPDRPDDSFHSILYCLLVSMIKQPRPDIIAPNREDPSRGPLYSSYTGTTHQG